MPTSKSLLAVINPGQRDILSDREPPEHHSEEYITGDGICRMQEAANKKRERREEGPHSKAATVLTLRQRWAIFKRAFHFSYLWKQVALSPSFFIFMVVVTAALCLLWF